MFKRAKQSSVQPPPADGGRGTSWSFKRNLEVTLAALLGFALLIAGLSYQISTQSRQLLERSRLAHEVLQEHLDIASSTYELFTIVGRNVIAAGGIPPVSLTTADALVERLARHARTLRQLMVDEIIVLNEQGRQQPPVEADRLAFVDRRISAFVGAYRALLEEQGPTATASAWQSRAALLDRFLDTEFRAQIKLSIDAEERQVVQTNETVGVLIDLGRQQMIAVALAALVFCVVSALWLNSVRASFRGLQAGVEAFAKGSLAHRIDVRGADEFARLGRSFNDMAAELETRRTMSETNQTALEKAVQERSRSLNEMNLGLVEAEQERRRFLADISHELRTPLTIIRGECDVALRNASIGVEGFRQSLGVIRDQAKQTSALVDDLLFIARKESGELRLKREEVDIGDLMPRIAVEVRTLAAAKQIAVSYSDKGADAGTARVAGDPRRLRQLFLVLLDNAIKYSPAGGTILVAVQALDTEVAIAIEDEGVGIPEAELPRVFDRYYRGGNATALHVEGVGLGLPVAKAIVEAHHGTIEVANRPERGARVVVTLPAAHVVVALPENARRTQ